MSRVDPETELPLDELKQPRGSSALAALGWGLACALGAGGLWAAVVPLAFSLSETTFTRDDLTDNLGLFTLALGAGGAVSGLIAGVAVGLIRGPYRGAVALILGSGAAMFGTFAGVVIVWAILFTSPWLHPLVSSSLVWTVAGLAGGISAYHASRWLIERSAEANEEEPAAQRVEWLLREPQQRWRDIPLIRVLPVLFVSFCALIGAAITAPSELALGLLAAGTLGLSVVLLLYRQESRLRALERRFHQTRET